MMNFCRWWMLSALGGRRRAARLARSGNTAFDIWWWWYITCSFCSCVLCVFEWMTTYKWTNTFWLKIVFFDWKKKERVILDQNFCSSEAPLCLFFCSGETFFLFQGLYKKRLITKSSPQRQTLKQRREKKK
jgi:hypothetical protein